MHTIEELHKCAKRELGMRRGVYPRWVASGKMKETAAAKEIELMEAITAHFAQLLEKEELL